MSQPPAYTPATDFSQDEAVNVGGRSTLRTDRLDAELDAIALTLAAVRANLSLLQRDDGKIRDAYVEPYNLSAACKAFALATRWTAAGKWITAHAYAVNDLVDVSGASYICVASHTSGVFATDYAASKWQIFTAASTAGGTSFTPASTISSTDVQSAIVEVNDESRATSLPMLVAFYGAY